MLFVLGGVRTPVGRYGGSLSHIRPRMTDGPYLMIQAIYERTMGRLRIAIRLLTALLLTLVARSAIDGFNVADMITGTAIALLLMASVELWQQGRRLRPDAETPQGGSDDDKCAQARGMACAP